MISYDFADELIREWGVNLWLVLNPQEKNRFESPVYKTRPTLTKGQEISEQAFVLVCHGLAHLPGQKASELAGSFAEAVGLDHWRRNVLTNAYQHHYTAFENCLVDVLKLEGPEMAIRAFPAAPRIAPELKETLHEFKFQSALPLSEIDTLLDRVAYWQNDAASSFKPRP